MIATRAEQISTMMLLMPFCGCEQEEILMVFMIIKFSTIKKAESALCRTVGDGEEVAEFQSLMECKD
jgi:hypothetical protein